MDQNRQSHADLVVGTVCSPSGAAVSPVAASWCRSALHHGLDPEARGQREFVDAALLAQLRDAHRPLIDVANPPTMRPAT